MTASTLTFQRLSAQSCFLIGCARYILGIDLEYSSIYYVTVYLLSIYYVYIQYILRICSVYTTYILSTCIVYHSNEVCIYLVYTTYITVISPLDWYMHGICMAYAWYIPGICSPHTYGHYIFGFVQYLFLQWYTIDVPCISTWYTNDTKGISL